MKSSISHASAQGSRAEQQDRYLSMRIELPKVQQGSGQLMAVMDGHGGHETAELLAEKLQPLFEESLKEGSGVVEDAIRQTFQRLADLAQKEPSGSTLSLVCVPDEETAAYVGVIGDSPVVIRNATGSLWISPLHNARSNPRERDAALARGALYAGGYLEDPEVPGYGLQLSRALGDCHLSRILTRAPDIQRVELGKGSFILIASDGVLDSMDVYVADQLTRLATLAQNASDARVIVEDALERRTGDNVTVILWKAS